MIEFHAPWLLSVLAVPSQLPPRSFAAVVNVNGLSQLPGHSTLLTDGRAYVVASVFIQPFCFSFLFCHVEASPSVDIVVRRFTEKIRPDRRDDQS